MIKKKLSLIFLLVLLGFNLYTIYPQIRREMSLIKRNLWAGYDWKMGEKLGNNFYQYTKFLLKEIPENASVMIPPTRFPWPQTGNKYYLNYFLYPRKLLDWDKNNLKKADYILALWGESEPIHEYTSGFPKINIKGKFIFYRNNDMAKIYQQKDYNYQNDMKDGIWGVIKIE